MLFRRGAWKGSVGPYMGEYYDNMIRSHYGTVVAYRGKKLVWRPSVGHDSWPFLFSDGSWADSVTGEFYDTPGRGKLLCVAGVKANAAARALTPFKRGR